MKWNTKSEIFTMVCWIIFLLGVIHRNVSSKTRTETLFELDNSLTLTDDLRKNNQQSELEQSDDVVVVKKSVRSTAHTLRHNTDKTQENDVTKARQISGNDINQSIGFHHWCREHQLKNMSYSPYTDKHLAKQYVNKVAPGLKTAIEYAYVTNAQNITSELLARLPENYLLKPNHMCGELVIKKGNTFKCKPNNCGECSSNPVKCLQKLCASWLRTTYSKGFELYYSAISPKCMFEELLGGNNTVLEDYRVFTFHGKPFFVNIDHDILSRHTRDVFTPRLKRLAMTTKPNDLDFPRQDHFEKPVFFEKMLKFAALLSKPFLFMRMDFFGIGDTIAFSEFSPSPQGCHGYYEPDAIEKYYGSVAENPEKYFDPEYAVKLCETY